jgi:hypothetical protein
VPDLLVTSHGAARRIVADTFMWAELRTRVWSSRRTVIPVASSPEIERAFAEE